MKYLCFYFEKRIDVSFKLDAKLKTKKIILLNFFSSFSSLILTKLYL